MMAARRPDHAREVREALAEPARVAELLGLERSRTERGKWRCPAHGGTSLSLRRGRDGTLQARCFGCELAGDVFSLLAAVRGLDARADFASLLVEGAELAGLWHVVADLRDGAAPRPRPMAPPKRPTPKQPEPSYPPADELAAVWDGCISPEDDPETVAMLAGRGLDAGRVEGIGCARVIPKDATLPAWATYGGRPWTTTGHRLVFLTFDSHGIARSVRAWRVLEGDTPKRLPPKGYAAGGLVLADDAALGMLRCTFAPRRVLIAEGEPDFATWASRPASGEVTAVLGVVSGAWSDELAARVPSGARAIVRTHADGAGDRYAEKVIASLVRRCEVLRLEGKADGEGR